MYINKKSPIPAYYQLKSIILSKIESGEYGSGNPIPSERDLSETMNISRMTVRQALNQLVSEGVLYREKGKGTFVSRQKFEQRNIMSFSDVVRKKGLVPSTRVLEFKKVEPEYEIGQILELKSGEMVYDVKRLRMAGNMPIAIEEVFIPEKYCPNMEKYDLTSSLYKLIKTEYSHTIAYVDNVIESSKAGREEKELLEIGAGISVLRVTATYFLETGLKLIYERSVYRSDEYKYSVRIYVNKQTQGT